MAKRSKRKIAGEQDDGTFDLSDVVDDPDELAAMYEEPGDEAVASPEDAGAVPAEDVDSTVRRLEHELGEANDARMRAMADLVNYRRRADENEIRARHDGVVRVVRSLMPVLDQFDLALAQDQKDVTVDQLLEGVGMIRSELAKALEKHVVSTIMPEIGDEFDPMRHQAVMREATDEQPANTVAGVLQIGYAVGDTVIRPASVTVAMPADAD